MGILCIFRSGKKIQSSPLSQTQAGLASEDFLGEVSSGLKSEEYKSGFNQNVLKVLHFTMRALGSWKGCKDHHGTGAGFQFRTLSLGTVEQGSLRGWETRGEAISIIQGRKSWGHQEETWALEERINVCIIKEVQLTWLCPTNRGR